MDDKSTLPVKKGSKKVNVNRVRKTLIDAMKKVVSENILACNNYELWYLINKELPIEEQISFRDFLMIRNPLTIRARTTIKMSEYYLEARQIVIEALIEEKRNMLQKYKKAKNYVELRKCEFILTTRFKDWGVDISEEQESLEVGAVYNIVINQSNSIPIRTEVEMLELMEENVDS